MTTQDAFLHAILECPADDAPRLIYADWLEENGESARAEFIRVQVGLARMDDDGLPVAHNLDGCCACVLCTLRRRERELYDRIWRQFAFMWDLRPGGSGRPSLEDIRRGFVFRVVCTAAEWLTHADELVAAAPLEEVRLTTRPEFTTEFDEASGRTMVCLDVDMVTLLGRRSSVRTFTPSALMSQAWAEEVIMDLLAEEWPRITFRLPSRD